MLHGLIALAQHAALLAAGIAGIGLLRRRLEDSPALVRTTAEAAVFAALALICALAPVELPDGELLDLGPALFALAGLSAGPAVALLAGLPVLLFHTVPGAAGAPAAAAGLAIAVGLGAGLRAWRHRRGGLPRPPDLALLGAALALLLIPLPYLAAPPAEAWAAIRSGLPGVPLATLAAVLLLGAMGIAAERRRALERQAAEGEHRFRRLADESLQGIVIHDGERRLYCNDAYARMLGLRDAATAMARRDAREHIPSDRLPEMDALWRRVRDGKESVSLHRQPRRRSDGSIHWVDSALGPITWLGRPAIQVILVDVTAQVEAEAELRRREATFRDIVDNLPLVLSLKDREHRFVMANREFERWFRTPTASLIGHTTQSLDGPLAGLLHDPQSLADEQRVLATGLPITRSRDRTIADGSVRSVIASKFAVHGVGDAIEGVGTVMMDVTELKHAQARLERREEELRRNQAAILAALREEHGDETIRNRIRRIMQLAAETLGLSNVSVWQIMRAEGVSRCLDRWCAPELGIAAASFPPAIPLDDGPEFYRALERGLMLVDDASRSDPHTRPLIDKYYGHLGTWVGIVVPIRLPDGVTGHVSFGYRGGERLWSTEDESLARSMAQVIGALCFQEALEQRAQSLRRNQETLVRIVGQELLTESSLNELYRSIAELGAGALGAMRGSVWVERVGHDTIDCVAVWDARVAAGEAAAVPGPTPIDMLQARYAPEYWAELARDLVVALDDVAKDSRVLPAGRESFVANGFGAQLCAMIRLPDAVLGSVYFTSATPRHWTVEDRAFARSIADLTAFAALAERHRQSLTALDLVTQGLFVEDGRGEVIYANRMARRLAGETDSEAADLRALRAATGAQEPGDYAGEIAWQAPSGAALELGVVRRLLPTGGAVTVIADITERRERERERRELEERFQQAAKLEAVGRLAGGIAHDFNNMLGAIMGFAGFLLEDLAPGSEQHGFAARIARSCEHAKEVVKQLLAFTRATEVDRSVADLRQIVDDNRELLRAALPPSTRFLVDPGPVPLPARINAGQIHQILLNLCINANDALEGRAGQVRLTLARVEAGAPELTGGSDAIEEGGVARAVGGTLDPTRPHARLLVEDDGTGMDPATLSRIFEPFFTRKERGRGTGLGLAVVHGIVMAYGGAYRVESTPGQGTRFTIYVPLETAAGAERPRLPAADPARGSESVLVVDDERDLLDMLTLGLERLGYRVTGCNDPVAALDAFRDDPAGWDIVVTDQNMPGMQGIALATRLREIRPDCPIILCTGFSDGATEREASAAGVSGFFLKPVEPTRIAEKIRALARAA